MINLIAAVGSNYEIGKNNKLIWHLKDDMNFFKKMTMGHLVVMGRITYESLPGELVGRKMCVISSHNSIGDNVLHFSSVDAFLEKYKDSSSDVFVIGGSSIYKQFIDYADCLYLTEINDSCIDADSFFPYFDKTNWDKQIITKNSENNIDFLICKYVRKK